MRFLIQHITHYKYSRPVFIEPHIIRLHPRSDMRQSLVKYQMEVNPEPAGQSNGLDAENNLFTQLWFNGIHDHLEIVTSAEVNTNCSNPYIGLLDNDFDSFPFKISQKKYMQLQPYLRPNANLTPLDFEMVGTMAKDVIEQTGGQTLTFLSTLTSILHKSIKRQNRTEQGIQNPHKTLTTGIGACRDLAMVFIEACRQAGIPARFVSGYLDGDTKELRRDLHAWAEAFLPGMGWKGYDPSLGLAVTDQHIVTAASMFPENAAPITGFFRGSGVSSKLEHIISIN